jgi:defect-in-organelle-trafficking protein DotC
MLRCKCKLQTALLLMLALTLQGCGVKPVCPPKKGAKKQQVISSDPTVKPYKVIGSRPQQPSIASVKESLKNASGNNDSNAAIGALRAQALRETALSLGARGGLAERALQINGTLLNYEPLLDRVFQFNGMILDDNILPPVLIEARNTLNISGGDSIRVADRNYKILSQAKFITAAPTWREYLLMSYDLPQLPDRSLLPRNKPERIMWENDLEEGWKAGLQQAELIFMENINRLVRDYKGMILYRNLLAQRIVSEPYVATLDMGITGNGDDMTVNDRLLRITAFPQLQADSSAWKTELHLHE